jgi:hypothetical protein
MDDDTPMTSGKLYIDVILKSRGTEALNRLHGRTFSVNILSMNAAQLREAIELTENPEFMIKAFQLQHDEASKQVHREVNRLAHNYLCAVSTFVDHSRNFMKQYYAKTPFHADYEAEVQRTFHSSEQARFVRDLRNYLTHRGLPDSNMTLNMVRAEIQRGEKGTDVNVTVGIYYAKARLAEWDGWTPPAKRFLSNCPEKIPLREIFVPHFKLMEDFNEWFEDRFYRHHKPDLDDLDALKAEFQRLEEIEKRVETPQTSP